MAGDWIKMRVWLAKDPKVISIARSVAFDREFMDWLTDPVRQKCDESALEHVTLDCVTRIVTCALLQVWGVANERGKLIGTDLVMSHSDGVTIDEIADMPGLADAMVDVGWAVIDREHETVTLPKFLTYNTPVEDRIRQQSRDRQARRREKNKRDNSVTNGVTTALQSHARLDEIREEKKEKNKDPPNPPGGKAADGFDAFWKAYPKKIGKAAAKRRWVRLKPGEKLQLEIVRAIETQARSEQWQREGGRFIPNPATWLNEGRWEDEVSAGSNGKPSFLDMVKDAERTMYGGK